MAIPKIKGAQRDFSFGEVDLALKRADDHPARQAGLRQMANARILNSGTVQNRPGRSALFPVANNINRIEEITIQPGVVYKIAFGQQVILIINSAGATVATFINQGNGFALPWQLSQTNQIDYAVLGLSIYITFPGIRPQVVSFDGVSTWSIADYQELVVGNQKRTGFYRLSPQGITIQPAATSGSVVINASGAVFSSASVGTRIRYVNRQILITNFTNSAEVTGTVEEILPGGQQLSFSVDPRTFYSIGDEVIGSVTGSKGVVTATNASSIGVQLLTLNTTSVAAPQTPQQVGKNQILTVTGVGGASTPPPTILAFTSSDTVSGPAGALVPTSVSTILPPQPVTLWDEEIINNTRHFPQSVFVDQFRLGFCNIPSLPGAIIWSAVNSPNDLYPGPNPDDAIIEIAPDKVQVLFVVPGPESSEFVFCDKRLYYIKIDSSTPLVPGSVSFQLLSSDGCGAVKPKVTQELILYANSGLNSIAAVIAPGSYYRPFNTKNLSAFHSHLFKNIQAIAVPSADSTFLERYAYVLNGDGSIAVGKYKVHDGVIEDRNGIPLVGWGPWSGGGTVSWIAALGSDVLFTSKYFNVGICEILDDTQYLDAALFVNNLPAAFTPPGGKGPLWWIPSQSVSLMDQVTRSMGTYQIDANGNIIPQFNGGENLSASTLVAGQPWTATIEPFCPDANPGQNVGQRMFKRRVSRFAAYVVNSTGFLFARLFSGPITPTSPALGTIMNTRRVTAWNQGDDPTKAPPLREEAQRWRPIGRSFDPRIAIIKDTPGPLLIEEIGMEASI